MITAVLLLETNSYLNRLEYSYRIHQLATPEDTGFRNLKRMFRFSAAILMLGLYISGGLLIKAEVNHESETK
jgi:hypothetical protein